MSNFILGSASQTRLELLKQINVIPDLVISPNVDEAVLKNEKPLSYAKRIVLDKVNSFKKSHKGSFILCADTFIYARAKFWFKPIDREDAFLTIKNLSGRSHLVYTSLAFANQNFDVHLSVYKTRIKVKCLNEHEINWYLDSNEWQNRSGGYSLNGVFSSFIQQINGSYTSVLGLPLDKVCNLLRFNNLI